MTFEEIATEAWVAAGGSGSAPVGEADFHDRLQAQLEPALEESYYEEMVIAGNRLRAAAQLIAERAISEQAHLSGGELEELSKINRSTMALAMRFSAAIMVDQIEGNVRRLADRGD